MRNNSATKGSKRDTAKERRNKVALRLLPRKGQSEGDGRQQVNGFSGCERDSQREGHAEPEGGGRDSGKGIKENRLHLSDFSNLKFLRDNAVTPIMPPAGSASRLVI